MLSGGQQAFAAKGGTAEGGEDESASERPIDPLKTTEALEPHPPMGEGAAPATTALTVGGIFRAFATARGAGGAPLLEPDRLIPALEAMRLPMSEATAMSALRAHRVGTVRPPEKIPLADFRSLVKSMQLALKAELAAARRLRRP